MEPGEVTSTERGGSGDISHWRFDRRDDDSRYHKKSLNRLCGYLCDDGVLFEVEEGVIFF
jgi:hypothetical protein